MDMKSTCPCPNLIGSLMGDPDTRYSSTEAAKTPFSHYGFQMSGDGREMRFSH
jgi:hypothetical protein